ncbi:MAG: hypothetical protein GYA62_10695 [Bacteroidales bacterium]|nr:hypothetical protein [Bacteroidales bacterium]
MCWIVFSLRKQLQHLIFLRVQVTVVALAIAVKVVLVIVRPDALVIVAGVAQEVVIKTT